MKHSYSILFVIIATTLSGCPSSLTPKSISLTYSFDEQEALRLLEDGNNTISGSALIRQQGGGIVTCAGTRITLVPATQYAAERIGHIYGVGMKGYSPVSKLHFIPDPPSFKTTTRVTSCDAQGNFEFDKVSDGEFFVISSILWKVGYSTEGGNLMHQVSVVGGEKKKVVLSASK